MDSVGALAQNNEIMRTALLVPHEVEIGPLVSVNLTTSQVNKNYSFVIVVWCVDDSGGDRKHDGNFCDDEYDTIMSNFVVATVCTTGLIL